MSAIPFFAIAFFSILVIFLWRLYFLFFQHFSFKNVIFKAKTKDKILVLTFDDGPNPKTTLKILEILKKYNLKATFFQIGQNIEKFPHLTEKIYKEGHIIGNHLFRHKFFTLLSSELFEKELIKTQELITKIIKKRPRFFRPPYLFLFPPVLKIVQKHNLILVGSTVFSTFEPSQPPALLMSSEILFLLSPGSILTLHEGQDIQLKDYKETTKALEKLIPKILKKGYKILPLSEILKVPPYL